MNHEQREKIKELNFIGHAVVKATRSGQIICKASRKITPDNLNAGAIIAADLLTAHISKDDWTEVAIKMDSITMKAAYKDCRGIDHNRISVLLPSISFNSSFDFGENHHLFEIASVLYFASQAIAELWNGMFNDPHFVDGEAIFSAALTGYVTDKVGLDFSRHLRMCGSDSPTMDRWVDKNFF